MTDRARIRRVLIVSLDNLGDLVFASALAPPLRGAFPNAQIDVWAKSYTAAVARLIPEVTDVIAADPFWAVAPHLPKPPWLPFVRSLLDVRSRRYDVAILANAPWRTAAAVAATRIPIRIGLERRKNARFLTHVLPRERRDQAVLQEQARLLAPLGIQATDPRYRLDAAPIANIVARIKPELPERVVALHPFAAVRTRCVPLGQWTALASALETRGMSTLWVGMKHELDEVRALSPNTRGLYVDRLGDGSLAATAAALSMSSMFIGHDSGPLHVAGALGVPVVGVFAPGEPLRTFPQGVAPSRMIARPSPEGITSETLLHQADALGLFSAS